MVWESRDDGADCAGRFVPSMGIDLAPAEYTDKTMVELAMVLVADDGGEDGGQRQGAVAHDPGPYRGLAGWLAGSRYQEDGAVAAAPPADYQPVAVTRCCSSGAVAVSIETEAEADSGASEAGRGGCSWRSGRRRGTSV